MSVIKTFSKTVVERRRLLINYGCWLPETEKLIDFRVHGMRPKYFHRYVGGNFRIDALQAAILHVKLPHLDRWAEGRRRNAKTYDQLFAEAKVGDRVVLPRELPRRHHIFNQYVIRFTDGRETRDKVMDHLKRCGIGCEVYYPLTLPQQECFAGLPCGEGSFKLVWNNQDFQSGPALPSAVAKGKEEEVTC